VNDREGLPAVSIGGAAAVSSAFAFWGKNWTWAQLDSQFKILAPFEYTIAGTNNSLQFDLSGRVTKASQTNLRWELEMNARTGTPSAIGGGMVFKFDLATFAATMGEPVLLPANRGWTWGKVGGNRMEMRFDPPLASVHFEHGQRSEIRAFVYQGEIPQGRRRLVATLSVAGNMSIGPTLTERFGLEDSANWPGDLPNWMTSPVDLSFLNAPERPSGKRGFLRVDKDGLVFEDGTPARFWGTNLTAATLFGTTRENAREQARRLSALGFNLVRLHHHDSVWVEPNIFGDRKAPNTRNLIPGMLDKIDWWIKCLKDEGIYVWLDLHVGRNFKAGDDIEEFSEVLGSRPASELRGYNYVNRSIVEALKGFNVAYVNHRNNYTGLRYRDDPAIVAMLVTNENDVTQHFASRLLPDKKAPRHSARYMAQANAFATRHGLPKDKVWRSWEYGPPKLFLNDLEHRFGAEMMEHLRSEGVRVPLATTSSWGENPISSLPALTTGDLIDVHSYGGIGELEKDPAFAPTLTHWIAAAQVLGKPLSVTEWNVQHFPVPDRHVVPLYMAASASLQGWDALMQYAYAQIPLNSPGGPSNWHSFNDPALLATLPAAALAYRRGDIREAGTTHIYAPDASRLFGEKVSPENSVALRTAAEIGKLVIALPHVKELPWLKPGIIPPSAKVITDPKKSLLPADADESLSDTGELRRNWKRGTYTIDTPRTQAAMGWIGGQDIRLADVEIAVTTRNATVAVQSLGKEPIGKAKAMMISLAARSVPTTTNQLPYHSEPVLGQIIVRGPKGLKLHSTPPSGEARPGVRVKYIDGRYHIHLNRKIETHWLVLR
jgi:hypothetical protein